MPFLTVCLPDNPQSKIATDATEDQLVFGPFESYAAALADLDELNQQDCPNHHVITKLCDPYT